MQSHQEYTPVANCWCPALEMLSDCHAWKIQSSPDNGGFPVRSNIHKHRDPTDMLALPIKNRYVAITMKTSYFCRGYSRPASSWRRQSTGCALAATYKPDIFTLVGPRVFQPAIARIETIGDNDPFWLPARCLQTPGRMSAKGGIFYAVKVPQFYSFLVILVGLHRARQTTKEQGGKQELTMPGSRVRKRVEINGLKASNTGRIFCDDS